MNFPTSRRSAEQGSVLIVALILCAIIGISLVSYIRLARTSLTVSNRALYNNAAMNLAENGLEEAMYAINQMVANPAYDWAAAGWTIDDDDAYRKWTSATDPTLVFDQNATGEVRVYIFNYEGISAPKLIARSLITLGGNGGAPVEKYVEVTLAKTSKFANGLVAKDTILFKGNNVSVDSWSSDPDNDPATAPVAYDPAHPNDAGSVGSVSVSVDAVLVKNADVWGYVSTGGDDPTDNVGPNGSILGKDSPSGIDVDPNRVSTDFTANFDAVTTPSGGTSIGSITSPDTYGTAGAATTIVCSDISLGGNGKVVIFQGDVTLIITAAAGTSAIDITGNNSGITIAADSSLKIYTAGDIALTGQGVVNTDGQAADFQLYGSSTSGTDQDIKIAGGGNFCGVIYAPNGSVTINGDGDMKGSVVAEDITLTGNAAFHYDESLANLDSGNPFRVSKWKELTTQAARLAYDDETTF